jgi:fluoride ion exporter CrcB/FEX
MFRPREIATMAVESVALPFTDRSLSLLAILGVAVTGTLFGLFGYWVYRDASAHGYRFPIVLVPVVLFAPFGLLLYLYRRRGWERERSKTAWDRRVETVIVAVLAAFVIGALVTPPDPFSQIRALPVFTLAALPLSYLIVYRDGWARLRSALPR